MRPVPSPWVVREFGIVWVEGPRQLARLSLAEREEIPLGVAA